jgi:hypothetical protein
MRNSCTTLKITVTRNSVAGWKRSRVLGKRPDTGRPGLLVLCWVYLCEGEAATATLDRHFREYDEKISRDSRSNGK